jgi:hypothetical protein
MRETEETRQKEKEKEMRFKVLTTASKNTTAFWDNAPCILVETDIL